MSAPLSVPVSNALLQVDSLAVRFGAISALDGVSFDVAAGHIVGLIGPNGAGKTTLFNGLSRLCPWSAGDIRFQGRSLRDTPPQGVAALGIARTFQNLALFATMSVRDNVRLGGHSRTRSGVVANALRLPWVAREEAQAAADADDILQSLGLADVADTRVSDLPFGTAKRVELGRALAARPKLLLLDEPAGGLNHEEVDALIDQLRQLRTQRGLTILLVEHHMGLVMRVSDRVVALDFGRKLAEGTPAEVQSHAEVVRAYLGASA